MQILFHEQLLLQELRSRVCNTQAVNLEHIMLLHLPATIVLSLHMHVRSRAGAVTELP